VSVESDGSHATDCKVCMCSKVDFLFTGKWPLQESARSVLARTNSAEAEVESFVAKTPTDAFTKVVATVSADPNSCQNPAAGSATSSNVRLPSQPLPKLRQFAANGMVD
jgi:hypothetical protein